MSFLSLSYYVLQGALWLQKVSYRPYWKNQSSKHSGQPLRMHESLKMLTGLPNACGVLWDIPTVLTRTLRFGDKRKWQNLSSTLAAQSAFCFKHRPVIVTNILCGSGSFFFYIFSSVFTGNSTMNITENKYSQRGQVYGRLHHSAVQSARECKPTHNGVSALET